MRRQSLIALSLLSLVATGSAQTCATLTVTGSGAPGSTLEFQLPNPTADAFAFLAIGGTEGTTTLDFGPLGSLTLGLDQPFAPVPLGLTDASGSASLSIAIPANAAFPQADLFAQGVVVSVSFAPPAGPPSSVPPLSLTFCTSNVVGFSVGS
jgi:hypothetical protein